MVKPDELVRHELIGLNVSIVSSTDPSAESVAGIVTGETRNMLEIEAAGKVKKFPKAGCVFSFVLPDGVRVRVEGALLVARPEDRVKKKFRKW